MFNPGQIEEKIRQSAWWQQAASTIDCHHSNTSGIMLTDHLQNVYQNVEVIFSKPETGFYGALFALVRQLNLNKNDLNDELKVIALLHDIGKTDEDKTVIIPHPLTGKPAHKRHGIVSLVAAMEILATDFTAMPEKINCIYRTIELHDISYGLYREYCTSAVIPPYSRWAKINNKIHISAAAGLIYLLIFKLADIHGHAIITDVLWFYQTVKTSYFDVLGIELPIPAESDIR
ncbi:MAG: hypothetical protein ABIN94_11410 [Ferruginibacter sp.]